jgi:hypothetical protein
MDVGRIAAATGAALYCENAFARLDRGAGLPNLMRLPYFPQVRPLISYLPMPDMTESPIRNAASFFRRMHWLRYSSMRCWYWWMSGGPWPILGMRVDPAR